MRYLSALPKVGVALTLATLTLSACSDPVPGTSIPATTGSAPTSGSASKPESPRAPRVQRPLNAAKFQADPCRSLTSSQLGNFGIKGAGERTDRANVVVCTWTSTGAATGTVGVSYTPAITTGLSNTYQLNESGAYKEGYFSPSDVNEYPAVYADTADDRSKGGCHLVVGISDQASFGVSIEGQPGTDGCKAAANVAKAVLQTIQEGQ